MTDDHDNMKSVVYHAPKTALENLYVISDFEIPFASTEQDDERLISGFLESKVLFYLKRCRIQKIRAI